MSMDHTGPLTRKCLWTRHCFGSSTFSSPVVSVSRYVPFSDAERQGKGCRLYARGSLRIRSYSLVLRKILPIESGLCFRGSLRSCVSCWRIQWRRRDRSFRPDRVQSRVRQLYAATESTNSEASGMECICSRASIHCLRQQ